MATVLDRGPEERSRLPSIEVALADSAAQDDAKIKLGRRLTLTVFYSLVVLFTLGSAARISQQVFRSGGAWTGDCRGGLRQLAASLDEAQRVSDGADLATEEALRRFRQALAPSWGARDAIEQACKATGDSSLVSAFDLIERLRYAEENAVRREGHDLAPLRRQVRGLLGGPLAP